MPMLGGAVDGRDRFRVVGHAVVRAHARAAEPDGGNAEVLSKHAIFHAVIPAVGDCVAASRSGVIRGATLEAILPQGQGHAALPRRVWCVNAALPSSRYGRLLQRAGRDRRFRTMETGNGHAQPPHLSRRHRARARRRRAAVVCAGRRHGGGQEGRQGGLVLLGAGRDRAEGREHVRAARPASRSSCSAPAAPTSCAASSRRATAARCSSTCSRTPIPPPPAR